MKPLKTHENFEEIDKAKFGFFQLKIILVSGAGFFTDAYDLFCINLVMPMIGYVYYYNQPKHAVPSVYDSLVKSSAAWGNLIGQLLFGYLADKFGRKNMYGIMLMIMIVATIGSSLAANTVAGLQVLAILGFWRFILGIGIGGDYPISSVITSEFASVKHRGLMISAVFAMQGCGMLVASFVAIIFLSILKEPIEDDTANIDFLWRIILGLGVVPAFLALYSRIKISESPRYAALTKIQEKTATVTETDRLFSARIASPINGSPPAESLREIKDIEKVPVVSHADVTFWNFISKWKNFKVLLGCCISWFALDIAFYGSNLNQSFVIQTVGFAGSGTTYETFRKLILGNLIVTLCGTFPGYWFTVCFIEKMGRIPIQIMGFVVSGLCWLILAAAFQPLQENVGGFMFIYILAQFFLNFGPNATTFVIPGEAFPTKFRSTCHGIAAASGKAGAIVAAQGFSILKDTWGIPTLLYIFAAFMLVGLVFTLLIHETKGKSLEELENHFIYAPTIEKLQEIKCENNASGGINK